MDKNTNRKTTKTSKASTSQNANKKKEIEALKKEIIKKLPKLGEPCVLDETLSCTHCGECLLCDLDSSKFCDNCGKCLDTYNTDEKGYVTIKIDKIIRDETAAQPTLEELYKQYGLDDDEDE